MLLPSGVLCFRYPRLFNWSFIIARFLPCQYLKSVLLSTSVSCLGFAFGFACDFGFSLNISFWTFAFDCVFDGLPAFPFGSCVDSGLSWLPLAFSPVGNGGKLWLSFLGEGPVFALAFAYTSKSGMFAMLKLGVLGIYFYEYFTNKYNNTFT